MNKKTVNRIIIKTIEEEVEIDIFVSKDGTIFDTEKECLDQEEYLDFLSYFENQYKIKTIDPNEYGLNFGHTTYCHLVYVEKLNDLVIDDFIRYYKLEDYPEDIIKFKDGWSFVALVSDVNLWIFDKTDRVFMMESLKEMMEIKKNELNLLNELYEKNEI